MGLTGWRKVFFNTFPYMGVVDNYYEAVIPHIWKKRVLYIDKGSNIKVERNKDFYGAFKNLSRIEDKPIYQYGYAFPIFVRWE